jgi:hypothetical protein
MERKGTIVSKEGEIIGELYAGDRIIRGKEEIKKKLSPEDKKNNLDIWKIEHFYKGNVNEIMLLIKDLSAYEKAFLFSVAPYIGFDDCCIKHANNKSADFEALISLTGISKGKLSEVINSLRTKDVIYKGLNSKGTQYFVNPWIFCKGSRINKVLKKMFENYQIRIFDKKRWKDIPDEEI